MVTTDELLIERLLRVIDEGRRTATYKLALLLAIVEAAALSPGSSELPTRLIAERVLARYLGQTRDYVDASGTAHQIRQIATTNSAVLRAVTELRLAADAAGRWRDLDDIRTRLPDDHRRTLDAVEDTFVRYPIPLLQVVGSAALPFLYHLDWSEGTGVRALRRAGTDRIRLLDGVADRLVVLGPMLRPLIELHWARDVARWSALATEDEHLRAHLFGAERTAFPPALVADLSDLQDGTCFYCHDRLPPGRTARQVDHFLAWSRWPNDAIENLVVADRCNNAKRDHLAASAHLARWRLRVGSRADDLAALADRHRWSTAPDRTWSLVHTTYTHVAVGTPLWLRGTEFEIARGPVLT